MWRYLKELEIESAILHSFLTQELRNKNLWLFKNQKVRILLTTDLAARGIDVKTVDLVINYDLCKDHREFVHRVGRCCRGAKAGTAISLVTQHDTNRIKAIELGIGEEMQEEKIIEEEALKIMSSVIKAKKKAEMLISRKGESEFFEKLRARKQQFRDSLIKRKSVSRGIEFSAKEQEE